jgi:peptidoglycan/LPS O-acetylase OafA/YrhL
LRPAAENPVKRLHSLDALRGLAALGVVFWHWQHFFALNGVYQAGWKKGAEPLYWLFRPLYDEGWAAVDLFFPLSGFVFFWLYGTAIRERQLGAGDFALLRISRLYPLHTATLLIAAVLQAVFHWRTGHWFVYQSNDWRHFASSLVMAQQWLPPTLDQCFNGPAWSVSIEVLLYGVFFCVVRSGLGGWRVALLIALGATALITWNEFIARGLMGFFVGGVVFWLAEWVKRRANARFVAQAVGLAAIAAWVLVVFEVYLEPMHNLIAGFVGTAARGEVYDDTIGWFFRLLFTFIVCPLTVLALALDEQLLGGRYGRLSPLGDISYSTYLIHIPLQMSLALTALSLGIRSHEFMSPFAMMAFFAVLIGLGTLSFRYFERPIQNVIRSWRRPPVATAASPS